MQITVNGETRVVPDGATVEQLIVQLGLAGAICAAEVNREIVPREKRCETRLADGDVVEIVTLVGGG